MKRHRDRRVPWRDELLPGAVTGLLIVAFVPFCFWLASLRGHQ